MQIISTLVFLYYLYFWDYFDGDFMQPRPISKATNSIMNELEAVAANTLSFLRIKLFDYIIINFRSLCYPRPNQLRAQLL